MWVSASVTGLAGGRSQKWTLSGAAEPSGCARRRFRYMCSVKNGVNGDITCVMLTCAKTISKCSLFGAPAAVQAVLHAGALLKHRAALVQREQAHTLFDCPATL